MNFYSLNKPISLQNLVNISVLFWKEESNITEVSKLIEIKLYGTLYAFWSYHKITFIRLAWLQLA